MVDSLQSVIVSNTNTDQNLATSENILSVTSASNTIIDDILSNHVLSSVGADTGIQNILIHGSSSRRVWLGSLTWSRSSFTGVRKRLQIIGQIFGMFPDGISHTKIHGQRRQSWLSVQSIDCFVELSRALLEEFQSPNTMGVGVGISLGLEFIGNKSAVVAWISPGLVVSIEVGLQAHSGLAVAGSKHKQKQREGGKLHLHFDLLYGKAHFFI